MELSRARPVAYVVPLSFMRCTNGVYALCGASAETSNFSSCLMPCSCCDVKIGTCEFFADFRSDGYSQTPVQRPC